MFDVFPPSADALDETGVPRIQRSFERARDTGQTDTMPLQRYDIPDGAGGFTQRFWSLISVPIRDAQGRVVGAWVQSPDGQVHVAPDAPLPAPARKALDAEAKRLTTWLDGQVVGTIYTSAAAKEARAGLG